MQDLYQGRSTIKRGTCVIVGAGIGGLGAAAALAPIFEHVVIIEKDKLPAHPEARKSVAQGSHLHSLLIAGLEILEKFFPGIGGELIRAGGHTLRAGIDQQVFEFGAWMPKRDLGLQIPAQSRPLLEHIVRNRVKKLTNITCLQETRVQFLKIQQNHVTGVQILDAAGELRLIHADAVIDAGGLGSPLILQLMKLFPDIEAHTETVPSRIAYVSACVVKPDQWRDIHENLLIIAEPLQSAGGALIDIENNQWCVSLHGRNGVVPPTDFDEWKEYAKRLPSPAIWERVRDAKLVGKIHTFKKPASSLRRLDLVENLPAAYFPVGDIISSVNPTFGQGMTVALGHADLLRTLFNEGAENQYVAQATQWSQKAWRRTVAYDSMFSVKDERKINSFNALRSLALNRQKKAHDDPEVHRDLVLQAQMLKV